MLLASVKSFAGLVVVCFLLGAFEAGLFPGNIYCMTFWYKQDERAIRAAWVLGGASLGSVLGSGPVRSFGQNPWDQDQDCLRTGPKQQGPGLGPQSRSYTGPIPVLNRSKPV